MLDRGVRRGGDWTIAAESGPWGEEFTLAAREWSPQVGVCVARTAEYLNWRYREHPLQKYEMLTARQGSRFCGYPIHHASGPNYIVADLLAEDDMVRSFLLTEATAVARKHRAQTLSMPWLATHPGTRILEKCGFRPRESSPVVLLSLPQSIERQVRPSRRMVYLWWGLGKLIHAPEIRSSDRTPDR